MFRASATSLSWMNLVAVVVDGAVMGECLLRDRSWSFVGRRREDGQCGRRRVGSCCRVRGDVGAAAGEGAVVGEQGRQKPVQPVAHPGAHLGWVVFGAGAFPEPVSYTH